MLVSRRLLKHTIHSHYKMVSQVPDSISFPREEEKILQYWKVLWLEDVF